MSRFHCSCGFAIDDAQSFGDHLGLVFDRDDDMGTDGSPHAEIIHESPPGYLCACGFTSADTADFNDHLLIVVIPADDIGIDGDKHIPVDTSTPHNWYVRRAADE